MQAQAAWPHKSRFRQRVETCRSLAAAGVSRSKKGFRSLLEITLLGYDIRNAILITDYPNSVSMEGMLVIRKLFKTGSSSAISIPKEMLKALGITNGDRVRLALEREQRRLVITSVAATGVNEKFARQVDDFIQHYRPALEELARRP